MKFQKILFIITASILSMQAGAQIKHAIHSTCNNLVYATPSAIEPGLSTTLQFSTSDTVFSISWSPASSLTNPDSVATGAHPNVTTTYTVSGTTSCGAFSDTITVFVKCMVAINMLTTPSYCPANLGTAKAVAWQGLAPYSYSWSNGQTTSSVSGGLAPGTYWLTVVDSDKCSVTDTFSITTAPITLGVTASLQTIEPSDSTLLKAVINDPGLKYTVDWSPSASVRSPKSISTYAFPTSNTTYTLTMTTGCGTFTDTVTINMGCSVSTNVLSTPFYCSPDEGTAGSIEYNGVPPYFYSWSNGQTTSRITGLAPGTYSLSVLDSYGCTTAGTVNIDSSALSLTIYKSNDNLKQGDSTRLYALLLDSATTSHTYSWSPSSSVTFPDSLLTVAHPSVTTTYTVTVSSSCGNLTDTVTVHVQSPTAIQLITPLSNSLVIYPNPAINVVTMSYSLLKDEDVNVSIVDVFGRTVSEENLNDRHAGNNMEAINVAGIAEGTYTLRMLTTEGTVVRKLVVVNSK